jgi:hypothetical protein
LQIAAQFDPAAVVLQCGASSLAADRLGSFNLTQASYTAAVELVCGLGKPLLVRPPPPRLACPLTMPDGPRRMQLLGGGGYSISKVARCWTAATAVALSEELSPQLPRGAASNPRCTLPAAARALGGHMPFVSVLCDLRECCSAGSYEYFAPSYALNVEPANMHDLNTPEYLSGLVVKVLGNLQQAAARRVSASPAVLLLLSLACACHPLRF